ncbi:hypothetical protein CE195_01610 [Sodalis-like symbiont of Philaenus spumarius]|nr:hypothetical protein CE195_01610 [Sodalis-like symbiont of Philaenus spumarius]
MSIKGITQKSLIYVNCEHILNFRLGMGRKNPANHLLFFVTLRANQAIISYAESRVDKGVLLGW